MPKKPRIPLPKSWPTRVKSTILLVIALAQYATAYTRAWAATSSTALIATGWSDPSPGGNYTR